MNIILRYESLKNNNKGNMKNSNKQWVSVEACLPLYSLVFKAILLKPQDPSLVIGDSCHGQLSTDISLESPREKEP